MSPPAAPVRIAILAIPEATAGLIYGMYDLFMSAGRDWGMITRGTPGPSPFAPLIIGRTPTVVTAHGAVVHCDATLADCPPVACICVPDINLPPSEPMLPHYPEETAWLRERHAAGTVLATACSGAMLLAEAGLLDGWEATTHWAYCDVMHERRPAVKVQPQRALVVSGEGHRLVMAGGGTSALDLTLYLIARFSDVDTAMQVARVHLIDWHHVGQQPYARVARTAQADDAVIARCQAWIADHYADPAPVAAMLRLSGLNERTFARRFRQATGLAPLEYVHTLRIEEAKQMLEAGHEPVEQIAAEVGYGDPAFFSRLFRRKVNLTPAQYRRRFGQMRRMLSGEPAVVARPH
jgi:transcriptional regulator GlxA family with amidase domain